MTPQAVNVGDDTLAFIKRWEGFSPRAYFDVVRWSIGYGTRSFLDEQITEPEAERRLRAALGDYARALSSRLTVGTTPAQTTALLSAAFNLGAGGIDGPVIDLCNERRWADAAAALREYCHAGGEKLDALVRRRDAEAALLESEPVTRGAPRVQYARTYRLVDAAANMQTWLAAAKAAFALRQTCGFSADDAGIGDLPDRRVILHGYHPPGMQEWFAEHYPGVDVMGDTAPAPPVSPDPPVSVTGALWGLHASADGAWGNPVLPPIIEMVKAGRIEAYKSLSNESAQTVGVLKRINPDMFFCVRLMGKVTTDHPTASEFVDQCGADVRQWYREGVRYFEIHNEPNLQAEGMWSAWQDGAEFSRWWLSVRDALRGDCPESLWGYPGLSPGTGIDNVRAPAERFMSESHEAMRAADWIGCHCYWQTETAMWTEGGGQYYKQVPHAGVPLLITEFSNPSPISATPKNEKAAQYVKYVQALDGVRAAFSFIASASSGFDSETWTQDMARIVGERNG